jgi:Protein of unknown function (DUF3500)
MKRAIFSILFILIFVTSCIDTDAQESTSVTCTTTGTVEQSSNAEIEALRQAMVAFRSSLSDDLLAQASNRLENERFYLWHNTPANERGARDGISYGDLSDEQLEDFKTMLQLIFPRKTGDTVK